MQVEYMLVLLNNVSALRKAGVKVVGNLWLWDTSTNLMRISEKAELRAKFSASIMAVMEQLQLDGFFLQWLWPGCAEVKIKFKWQ
jgi:GH18 family chitinase